jgi:alkylhydroperoxidase family enzyme
MAWIPTVSPEKATGLLKTIYDTAIRRVGRVFHILSIQSIQPRILRASTRLYIELMHSPNRKLRRYQREMIAVTVSQVNDCFY